VIIKVCIKLNTGGKSSEGQIFFTTFLKEGILPRFDTHAWGKTGHWENYF
jgi:hypothetical protein